MPHCLAIGAATALAALALAGPATAQQVTFNGGLLYHQETLTAGVKSFKVTCPAGHVAVSGGVFLIGAQTKQLTSVPGPGARVWTFGFGYAGAGPTTVIVMVTCVKPSTKKVKLKFKTPKYTFVVPPLKTTKVKLSCPAGTAPVGSGGAVQVPSGPKSEPRARSARDVVPNQIAIETKLAPVRGGFDVNWHNPSTQSFQVKAASRCMTRKAKRKRRRRKPKSVVAEVVRLLVKGTVKPGFNRLTKECGKGRVAVMAGWELPPTEDVHHSESLHRTDGAAWNVENMTMSSYAIRLHLLCIRGRFQFQRDV